MKYTMTSDEGRQSGIYVIRTDGDPRIYIGSAKWLRRRLWTHLYKLRANKNDQPKLQAHFNKYRDRMSFELLEICPIDSLIKREQHYLDTLHPQLNILTVAKSSLGFQHTDQSKRRISKVKRGYRATPETRDKLSRANTGHPVTQATRDRISRAQRGVPSPKRRESKLLHPDMRAEMKTMILNGCKAVDIARAVGRTTRTIYHYKRLLKENPNAL